MNLFSVSGGGDELDWLRRHQLGRLQDVARQIERVRGVMSTPDGPPDWAIANLRGAAQSLGEGLDDRLRAEFGPQIEAVRFEAMHVADAAEIRSHSDYLRICDQDVFKSVVSARGTIEAIDESVARLRALAALDGSLAEAARRGKERAVRYRGQKRIDAAEVAEAGGNSKKGAKLRAEAAVMLRQDWAMGFPGETAPGS